MLYFELLCGASGDMILGSLIDAGLQLDIAVDAQGGFPFFLVLLIRLRKEAGWW